MFFQKIILNQVEKTNNVNIQEPSNKIKINDEKKRNITKEEVFRTHIVKEGDTLETISVKYFNNKSRADSIFKWNSKDIISDRDKLIPGMKLKIYILSEEASQ